MKRLIFLLTMVMVVASLNAQDTKRRERLSPEQFQARQQEYLTKVAELVRAGSQRVLPPVF